MGNSMVYTCLELLGKGIEDLDVWFPNGKNGVHVKLVDTTEYYFYYISKTEWRLETRRFKVNEEKRLKKEAKKI